LTGEHGHYELTAGRDPLPYIQAIENFANAGHMISEQLWDDDDQPDGKMKRGLPTGAAMPLCWSHAEYVSLVRSRNDGVCFDRVEPAYERYVKKTNASRHEIWTFHHPTRRLARGKTLRVILAAEATIIWTTDAWTGNNSTEMTRNETLNLWFADVPTGKLPAGATVEFTFFWKTDQRWEGRNWQVAIT
jgi:glucoamylase